MGKAWVSKIGYGVSLDGENFTRAKKPIFEPTLEIEKNGVEDPRLTKIGSTYYMTYTAYDGQTARLSWARSNNLKTWNKLGEMLPQWDAKRAGEFLVPWDAAQQNNITKAEWLKAGALFPEKINGKYWLIFGDRHLWLATSKNLKIWSPEYQPFISPRRKNFDSAHIEMGPPPIRTRKGWLVLYHGVDENMVYRLGFLLLDLHNPAKVIKRTNSAIFEPVKPYEISGLVDILPGGFKTMETMSQVELQKYINQAKADHTMPSVIFCPGAILIKNQLRIFYGASDSVICTATAQLNDILKAK